MVIYILDNKGIKEPGSVEKLSEKEASALLTQMETIEESLFTLRKKFIKDLQDIETSF